MNNVSVMKYKLNKRNVSLHSEITKTLKFYFKSIISIELDGTELNISYSSENIDDKEFYDKVEKVITDFVKGFKHFNSIVLTESKTKKEECITPSELDYIEVAHGVRCKIGQRAIIEENLENKIIELHDKFPNCRFRAPSMMNYENLVKVGYFKKFPNLINFVKNFKKDPELINKVSKGDIDVNSCQVIEENTELSKKVLNPVTCYQLYPLASRLIEQTGQSNFTVSGRVYRFESYNMNSTRLNEFTVIEQVHFDTKEELIKIRMEEIDMYTQLLNDWELDFTIETSSDVFYGNEASILMSTQKMEKNKYEIKMKCDKGYISVGSFNLHNQYFTENFDIRRGDVLLSSSCTGVGVERLMYCILSQHGEDTSKWPKKLQEALIGK